MKPAQAQESWMGKSAGDRFGRIVPQAGLASAVLLMAAGFCGGLHAAGSVASTSAMVVAPITVTENDIQLRFQSVSGAGRLTAKTGETLTYTVIVRDLSEDNAAGDVVARAAKTVSVTLAYD